MPKQETGVTLRRIWQAWCSRCGWRQDFTTKSDASWALGSHQVNKHGGTPRIGEED